MKKTFASLLVLAALVGPEVSAAPEAGYHIIKKVSLPGAGGWDYVFVDAGERRVYVSHATQVEVLNADTFEVVGTIPDTARRARDSRRARIRPRLHHRG